MIPRGRCILSGPNRPLPRTGHPNTWEFSVSSAILLVEPVSRARASVAATLEQAGHEVTTVLDLEAAVSASVGCQLVIIDADDLAGQAQLAEQIQASRGQAAVAILCVADAGDLEGRIRLLESGADDVIARPFDARELEARVEALLLRQRRSDAGARGGSDDGGSVVRTIACFGPKGGSGTTTVAVNLAAWAAKRQPDRVLLVDLDLQWGQAATFLDVEPRLTITDLLRDDAALRDSAHLRAHLVRHESGLWVLPAPGTPAEAELVTTLTVQALLQTAREAFDTIVLDLGSTLDERTLAAIETSDSLVIPVVAEVPALRPVALLLRWLREASGIGTERLSIVLNHLTQRQLVARAQVEATLGFPVIAELPHHDAEYSVAANTGRPVVLASAGGKPAKAIEELAGHLLGGVRGGKAAKAGFSLLRR